MTVRVIVQGFGAMGQAALTALARRRDAEVVALLDVRPDLVGRRAGDLVAEPRWADLVVQHPDSVDLDGLHADVAVHATTAFAIPAAPQIIRLLQAGMHVVTLCQELVYPRKAASALVDEIDRVGRAHGRGVVAGGVNPGWILDLVPIAASLGCVDLVSVRAARVVDFSPYGPDEMVHIGAGLDPASFAEGAEAGRIGHIGLLESAAMVADALGLDVREWVQTKEPIIAQRTHLTPFATVHPGGARGFRQRVLGHGRTDVVIDMEMIGLIDIGAEDPSLGDRIQIEGSPAMSLTIHGDDTAEGGIATAGVVTNLIGPVMASAPGFHTVLDLPLARSRSTLALDASRRPADAAV